MRPFPTGIDEHEALQYLAPRKSVDCATDSMLQHHFVELLVLWDLVLQGSSCASRFYQVPLEGRLLQLLVAQTS